MKRAKILPRPIYRRAPVVSIEAETDAECREWNARIGKPAAQKMAEHLDYLCDTLRRLLRAAGAEFKSESDQWPDYMPGYTRSATGGDIVRYRDREVPPEVPQAVKALLAIDELRRAEGEARVLAAYNLGCLVERYNIEVVLAKPVDDVRRREEARKAGHIPPEVVAATKAWWAAHRAKYPSDLSARTACAAAIGGKPTRVRTIIEKH